MYNVINIIAKAWLSVSEKIILHSNYHSELSVRPANEEDRWHFPIVAVKLPRGLLHDKNEINDYAEFDKNLIISGYPADEDIAVSISNKEFA